MDLLVARYVARQADARRRAEHLRGLVPAMGRALSARGASRVVLFGSLARGDEPHGETDVDLAVWGLSLGELCDAAGELSELAGARVDLVPAEWMSERLAAAVAREGVGVLDVAG